MTTLLWRWRGWSIFFWILLKK